MECIRRTTVLTQTETYAVEGLDIPRPGTARDGTRFATYAAHMRHSSAALRAVDLADGRAVYRGGVRLSITLFMTSVEVRRWTPGKVARWSS